MAVDRKPSKGEELAKHRGANYTGSFGEALLIHSNVLNTLKSKEDIVNFLENVIRPFLVKNYNTKDAVRYCDQTIEKVKNMPFMKSYIMLYDILQKGEGNGMHYESFDPRQKQRLQELAGIID